MAMQAHWSNLLWTDTCPLSIPSLLEPGSLLPDLPTDFPFPGKRLKLVYSEKRVSNVQVELVRAYVEENAWLRMGSIDQEVTGCSQSSQPVACFLSPLDGRSRILFSHKYTFVVCQHLQANCHYREHT